MNNEEESGRAAPASGIEEDISDDNIIRISFNGEEGNMSDEENYQEIEKRYGFKEGVAKRLLELGFSFDKEGNIIKPEFVEHKNPNGKKIVVRVIGLVLERKNVKFPVPQLSFQEGNGDRYELPVASKFFYRHDEQNDDLAK
jgi:hypothetical protein